MLVLRGLTWLILFQLLGTVLNVLLLPILPGPIIGLLLLLAFLRMRGEVSESLSQGSTQLLRFLPLFLIPPAVGVIVYAEALAEDFWAIAVSLVVSLAVSLVFAGRLMQTLIDRKQRKEGDASASTSMLP